MFAIDFLELGVWTSIDYLDTLEDAIMIASSLAETYGDHRIRIITPDGKYL